jgi:hypothetical protein
VPSSAKTKLIGALSTFALFGPTIFAARRNVLLKLQADRDGPHDTGIYDAAERGADEVLELLARRGKR